ncbi:hypothetical protein K438DRAFT_1978301 [Mycena galopus ATCC 62051]|nr:hypothetical protein K438DRAFT_1978301 [Mycena galopus ATCC 62051]
MLEIGREEREGKDNRGEEIIDAGIAASCLWMPRVPSQTTVPPVRPRVAPGCLRLRDLKRDVTSANRYPASFSLACPRNTARLEPLAAAPLSISSARTFCEQPCKRLQAAGTRTDSGAPLVYDIWSPPLVPLTPAPRHPCHRLSDTGPKLRLGRHRSRGFAQHARPTAGSRIGLCHPNFACALTTHTHIAQTGRALLRGRVFRYDDATRDREAGPAARAPVMRMRLRVYLIAVADVTLVRGDDDERRAEVALWAHTREMRGARPVEYARLALLQLTAVRYDVFVPASRVGRLEADAVPRPPSRRAHAGASASPRINLIHFLVSPSSFHYHLSEYGCRALPRHATFTLAPHTTPYHHGHAPALREGKAELRDIPVVQVQCGCCAGVRRRARG